MQLAEAVEAGQDSHMDTVEMEEAEVALLMV